MEKSQSRLGVVVVNWNRARDTLAAYMSLKSSTFEDWWLYIVDNASDDNSVELLERELFDRSTIILSHINAGFSRGCNLGIQRALSEGCTQIFLLNNDATVLPSTIKCLIDESAKLNESAILGCAVKISGTDKFQFFGSRTRKDVGHPVWFDDKDREKLSNALIETDFVLGAALFAPAKIWRKLGYFDERFYLNYEETDWCYRARKFGFSCYIAPSSVIIHKVGATIGPIDGPLQKYFLRRNELLFGLQHANKIQIIKLFIRTTSDLINSAVKDIIKFHLIKPSTIAHAIALYDFARGKFGDCPKIIRDLAHKHTSA
jgi:GT2 family glycosyltransferase